MKTINLAFLCLIIIGLCNSSQEGYSQSKTNIRIPDPKKVQVIDLKGNGYERGVQHGQQLKNEIKNVFEKWKANIAFTTNRNADVVIQEFLGATDFEPAIKRWTPDILDEVRGIADGSGQKYDDVFAFQLVDEFWVYLDRLANIKTDHCSGIGVCENKNNPACIAQNMDLETFMNGFQVLLHITGTDSEPEQYILTCAGFIAATGMNAKGIAICCNTLMELNASENGLPVAFIVRGFLSKRNEDDALSFLKNIKHASGQNYIVGIQDSVYDFESSANQVIRFYPDRKDAGIVYHTNHALANHDVKPWYQEYHKKVLAGQAENMNSAIRFKTLEKNLERSKGDISADVIKKILRSKDDERNPVCVTYKEGNIVFTFSSVLYTLTGKRSVQITHGSPDLSEYYEYYFKK
jgi:isopenicillin-N N-acyltransferase like protein